LEGPQAARSDDHADQGEDPLAGRQVPALRMSSDREHDKRHERRQHADVAAVEPRTGMGHERDRDERGQDEHAKQPPRDRLERRRALAVVPVRDPAGAEPIDECAHHRRSKR
jgi:hypothetical protein